MSVSKQHAAQDVKCAELLDVAVLNPSLSFSLSFYAKGEARHIPHLHAEIIEVSPNDFQ